MYDMPKMLILQQILTCNAVCFLYIKDT